MVHIIDVNCKHFTAGKLTKCVSPVSISNGIGWSKDNKTMYYNDSLPAKVYRFDFNVDTGTISNQQVLIDYSKDKSLGLPDGLCTDVEGRLWIASYGGKTGVNCWDAQTGEHIRSIPMPGVCNVTSCCFGGPNCEWLFVTSANVFQDPSEYPNAGSIFIVKGLGTRGTHAYKYKL